MVLRNKILRGFSVVEKGNLTVKFIVYFSFGFLVATYFPDFIPFIKSAFIESGARDATIETLQRVR